MATKPLDQCFQDEIDAVVDKYRDQGLTLGQAIGTLSITGYNLWRAKAFQPDEEEEP